jgi:hypothetical protein
MCGTVNKGKFTAWLDRMLEVTIERELEAEGQGELFSKTAYAAQREILLLINQEVQGGKLD